MKRQFSLFLVAVQFLTRLPAAPLAPGTGAGWPAPAIHCIGAALGFLTGDQVRIPHWADQWILGWLFRGFNYLFDAVTGELPRDRQRPERRRLGREREDDEKEKPGEKSPLRCRSPPPPDERDASERRRA